jgi:RNA polymerase sigma factor (sigma-70 family)
MPTSPISEVIQHLRSVWLSGGADLTDAQLLECFVSRREPVALEALVRRHAPMVWGVCRRVLRHHDDAEDAFQATFLVLVRKAATIRFPAQLGNWLYGVAHRTALKARATRAKRKERERPVTGIPEPIVTDQGVWKDLQALLDQELSRLPEKYRTVLVLCELEGKTGKEAARQLDLPQGTVASRLARARTMLAKRLGSHGLAVPGGVLAALFSPDQASAGVPTSVLSSTIKAVTAVAAGQAAAGVVSLNVAALAEGVMKAMVLMKLKCAMMVLLVAATVVGSGAVLYRVQAADPGQPGWQPLIPPTVAEQNPPVDRKPEQDQNQESKKPKEKGEGATPKAGTAKGEADEIDRLAKPSPDRVKQVRQMYAKLPSDILGVAEPTKRILTVNSRGTLGFNIILEDANGKKWTIHLLHGPLAPKGSPLLLSSGRLPPRGPEESAVYGLLLRLAANPPEKTMPSLLQAVDAILAVLDERFAGAIPTVLNGAVP